MCDPQRLTTIWTSICSTCDVRPQLLSGKSAIIKLGAVEITRLRTLVSLNTYIDNTGVIVVYTFLVVKLEDSIPIIQNSAIGQHREFHPLTTIICVPKIHLIFTLILPHLPTSF
jgi:hypothetical protein